MAAAKPEVVIYHLVDYIEAKYQRLYRHIRILGTHRIEISTHIHLFSESRNSIALYS